MNTHFGNTVKSPFKTQLLYALRRFNKLGLFWYRRTTESGFISYKIYFQIKPFSVRNVQPGGQGVISDPQLISNLVKLAAALVRVYERSESICWHVSF